MTLDAGDILAFDYPIERAVDLLVNGKLKYKGYVRTAGRKLALQIDQLFKPAE